MRWGTGNCGPEQLSGSTGTESPGGVKSGSQVGAVKLETLAAKLGKRVEPEAQWREAESECFGVKRPHNPELWGQMRGQNPSTHRAHAEMPVHLLPSFSEARGVLKALGL